MMNHSLAFSNAAILRWLVLVVICCTTIVNAAKFTTAKSGAWSDHATWGNNNAAPSSQHASRPLLPGPGDDVVVSSGTTVILDALFEASAILNTVTVQSQAVLSCPRNVDLSSTTGNLGLSVATFRIQSGGCFSCGYGNCTADAETFAAKFVLRLTSPTPPPTTAEDVRTLMVDSGASLFLSGAPRVRAITRLVADVEAGQATLQIADADLAAASISLTNNNQAWRMGDRVAIGPTDRFPGQTEYGTIIALDSSSGSTRATTITLSDPLKYARNGRTLSLVNEADNNRRVTVDARAEIALLSRNVVIEGTNDAVTGLGGDLMMAGSNVRARLSWVELRYLGRRGHLARYPLHIHNLGSSGRNVYVSNSVIHSSFQRGIVIHCTDGVTLVNNTVAGSPGFAYMLEDGAEENNTLVGNYAIDVRSSDYPLIQTERVNSAGFWFVNAANTFVGNVVAGVAGVGFSLDMDPVLNARPATLTTCSERLPGYDAKLARENATEFNRAVNTALIKKNFVRFDDNAVHSAHSGLWMSYPFTPMFPVERPVPIVRFTAWNIAARQMPSSLDSSDGISLQFDGCVRLQGQRGMHVYRLTCVNTDSMATWASCVNTFDGTIVAWVGDAALKRSMQQQQSPNATSIKSNGMMFTHLEPQVFLRTQVSKSSSMAAAASDLFPTSPLFATVSKGGPIAALNTIGGLVIEGIPPSSSPLLQLNAGDMQVFTDATGDAFGAGPGALVAATAFNASGVDPVIETYVLGQCTTGTYSAKRSSWPGVTSSLLPNGRTVAVAGGLPMLCRSAGAGAALRFGGLSVGLLHSSNWTRPRSNTLTVDIGSAGALTALQQPLRRTSTFPALVPLNDASISPAAGGYFLRPVGPLSADVLEITLTPTIQPSDGMTFVIAGLPSSAHVSTQQPGGAQPLFESGASTTSCRQMVGACASTKRTSNKPLICTCVAAAGEIVVRVQAGLAPRTVGLATDKGWMLGIFDFPAVRIKL